MAIYEFRCPEHAPACRNVLYQWPMEQAASRPVPNCDHGAMVPRFSVSSPRPFQEHYNASVGTHVSTKREHADLLKKQSEEMSQRTGMDHNFVPVDPQDLLAEALKDDDVGVAIEASERAERDRGKWIDPSDLVSAPSE